VLSSQPSGLGFRRDYSKLVAAAMMTAHSSHLTGSLLATKSATGCVTLASARSPQRGAETHAAPLASRIRLAFFGVRDHEMQSEPQPAGLRAAARSARLVERRRLGGRRAVGCCGRSRIVWLTERVSTGRDERQAPRGGLRAIWWR
jgi:hypothetical protein